MENELNQVHFQEFSIGYDNIVAKYPVAEMKKEAAIVTQPKANCDAAKVMDDVIMVPVGQEGLMVPLLAL